MAFPGIVGVERTFDLIFLFSIFHRKCFKYGSAVDIKMKIGVKIICIETNATKHTARYARSFNGKC